MKSKLKGKFSKPSRASVVASKQSRRMRGGENGDWRRARGGAELKRKRSPRTGTWSGSAVAQSILLAARAGAGEGFVSWEEGAKTSSRKKKRQENPKDNSREES